MTAKYAVERTTPTVYLDARNNAIQGFIVFVHLLDYDELHEIRVATLDKKTVQAAIDKLVNDRDTLANLGG